MKFHSDQIGHDPVELQSELPASILDLNEREIQANEPIRAHLWVRLEEGNFIVHGTLSTKLELQCGRCLDWFPWPVEINDFYLELEPPHPQVIDLTPSIREDILLKLPFNAVCRLDENYRCPFSGKSFPPDTKPPESIGGKEMWQALDKLKIKE